MSHNCSCSEIGLDKNNNCVLCGHTRPPVPIEKTTCERCHTVFRLCLCETQETKKPIEVHVEEIYDSVGPMKLLIGIIEEAMAPIAEYNRFKVYDCKLENKNKSFTCFVLVILDTSKSMEPNIFRVKEALRGLIADVPIGTVLSLVSFNTIAQHEFTFVINAGNRDQVEKLVEVLVLTCGSTNYTHAMEIAREQIIKSRQAKRFVVFITDDGDTSGYQGKIDIDLQELHVEFRAMGFGDGKTMKKCMKDASLVVDGDSPNAVQSVFDNIREAMGMIRVKVVVPSEKIRFSGLSTFDPQKGKDTIWVCPGHKREMFLLYEPENGNMDGLAELGPVLFGTQEVTLVEGECKNKQRRRDFLINRIGLFTDTIVDEPVIKCKDRNEQIVIDCRNCYASGIRHFCTTYGIELTQEEWENMAKLLVARTSELHKRHVTIDYGESSTASNYKRARK